MGDGLAPLPQKLIKRILHLEFVEMADLLPEAWLLEETTMEAQLHRQKGPVTDIAVWVQCYATLVSHCLFSTLIKSQSLWRISYGATGTMRVLRGSCMIEHSVRESRPLRTCTGQ